MHDPYVESLAADLYAAAEAWFQRVDPYHAICPRWAHLAEEHKPPYREAAATLIANDTARAAAGRFTEED